MILDMQYYNIILRMNYLSPYHATLDFDASIVIVAMSGIDRFKWECDNRLALVKLISFIHAKILIWQGCLAFPTHL